MLELFAHKHAENLAKIISTDNELNKMLSAKPLSEVTKEEFFLTTSNWIKDKDSLTYAVVFDGFAIGLASLVADREGGLSAGIWIASAHWKKGIGTNALCEILKVAKKRGADAVCGRIQRDNAASIAMCKKLGGVFKDCDDDKVSVIFALAD